MKHVKGEPVKEYTITLPQNATRILEWIAGLSKKTLRQYIEETIYGVVHDALTLLSDEEVDDLLRRGVVGKWYFKHSEIPQVRTGATKPEVKCDVMGCEEYGGDHGLTITFPFASDSQGRAMEDYKPFIKEPAKIFSPLCEKHAIIWSTSDSIKDLE